MPPAIMMTVMPRPAAATTDAWATISLKLPSARKSSAVPFHQVSAPKTATTSPRPANGARARTSLSVESVGRTRVLVGGGGRQRHHLAVGPLVDGPLEAEPAAGHDREGVTGAEEFGEVATDDDHRL